MLDLNLVFQLVALLLFLTSSCLTSSVQSICNKGCDLALGWYYTHYGSDVDSLQLFIRINLPFHCDCINGEFLGHVFNYNVTSADTYETIAQESYSNLTTAEWIQRFNTYDSDRLPDTGNVNVTFNCSCGNSKISKDYGLFLTYPLRPGETLESISSAANLSSDLIRNYNPGVNFSQGSGLIYIPGRSEYLVPF
ncbi:putative non-specific serine/threonine protein kinase [Helianthus debilis subsp. tardiflorus]